MNVSQLIEHLTKMDGNATVKLAGELSTDNRGASMVYDCAVVTVDTDGTVLITD